MSFSVILFVLASNVFIFINPFKQIYKPNDSSCQHKYSSVGGSIVYAINSATSWTGRPHNAGPGMALLCCELNNTSFFIKKYRVQSMAFVHGII